MKKYVLLFFSLLTLMAFAACSNTIEDISTSDGGEVVITESDMGTVNETIDPADGEPVTGQAEYESYTLTYTDPDGYTVTEDAGGSVTYSLDGYDVGTIVYAPATVSPEVLDAYYAALEADIEELQAYVAEYADGLDVDYEASKVTVNGEEAILVTGTVTDDSVYGVPGDIGYVLIMPIGDQLIILRGFADAETADIIREDLMTFAGNIQSEPISISSSAS